MSDYCINCGSTTHGVHVLGCMQTWPKSPDPRDAEIAALQRQLADALDQLERARFAPMGDNHHNAAACPYCRPTIEATDRETAALRQQLAETQGGAYTAIAELQQQLAESKLDRIKWRTTLVTERDEARRQLANARDQYDELLYAVGNKYPGETRHQTALRYIRQAEAGNNIAGVAKGATE